MGLFQDILGGGGLTAAAGLLGDFMSQSGQQDTNAMNLQIAQMQDQFNAQQAQINRDWQTQMSNTAMQRRVTDLKAAGLNPLLAVGGPGAPVTTGAQASASGNPTMMNPNAAFANTGAQIAAAAQTRLTNAQAAQTEAYTPDDPVLTRLYATNLAYANARNAAEMADVNAATVGKILTETDNLPLVGNKIKAEIQNVIAANPGITANSKISELDATKQQALLIPSISAAMQELKTGQLNAAQTAKFQNSWFGNLLNAVGLGPGGGAAPIAGAAAGALSGGATAAGVALLNRAMQKPQHSPYEPNWHQ